MAKSSFLLDSTVTQYSTIIIEDFSQCKWSLLVKILLLTFCIDLATINVYTKNAKGIIHYRFSVVYSVNQYNHIVII